MADQEQNPSCVSVEHVLPTYECHKKVRAAKITNIEGNVLVLFVPGPTAYTLNCVVPGAFIAKHHPRVGDYYVQYEDGYASVSPAHAFENGYARVGA